ncbi:MAG: signal peptidase I [Patescibacteria group bacterium]
MPEQKQSLLKSALLYVAEIVQVVLISLAIIIPVRYFLVQPFYVQGASMEPNFADRDYLIIDEISYRFRNPERGEIVVFKYPNDPKQVFIKRIVGLPSEKINISGGKVTVYNGENTGGQVLNEDAYLSPYIYTSGEKVVTLKSDEYFVLGDNRNSSLDSRIFGPVNQRSIIGKVWLRGWPFDKIKKF